MRIAYIGQREGTARHRALALGRLGHDVAIIDPRPDWLSTRSMRAYTFQVSGFGLQGIFARHLLPLVDVAEPELIWVNQGEFLGRSVVAQLAGFGVPLVCYLNDDPFAGGVRSRRFRSFRSAIPHYDVISVVRDPNIGEVEAQGGRKVVRVRMSADEIQHAPPLVTQDDRAVFASDVSFIGTWFPERGPFLARLMQLGVPLSIWGANWRKAPEWPVLSKAFRGEHLSPDGGYAKAIALSKISLGLLSKQNRDEHTTRSSEIPAIGGLLCAEDTPEHRTMFEDGHDAVFWKTPEDCARLCLDLLADEPRRQAIAAAGHARVKQPGYMNESVIRTILDAAHKVTPARSHPE